MKIRVSAPATIANLGAGFDVFGLAIDKPRDIITVEVKESDERIIEVSKVSGKYAEGVDTKIEKNSAAFAAKEFLKKYKIKAEVKIEIEKNIPPKKGLGSSSAMAAATIFALNKLFNLNLTENNLIDAAAQGEIVDGGHAHADNVAAAILGGFVIISSYNPLNVVRLETLPKDLEFVIGIPEISIDVSKARSVIPRNVAIAEVIHNIGQASALVAGFAMKDIDLIGRSMNDAIVEPARAYLIPGYKKVKKELLKNGALGVTICGSGPSILAVAHKRDRVAEKLGRVMKDCLKERDIECEILVAYPSNKGVRIE